MADVNTVESSDDNFVFGQKMEDRVEIQEESKENGAVKVVDSSEANSTNHEQNGDTNGSVDSTENTTDQPSACDNDNIPDQSSTVSSSNTPLIRPSVMKPVTAAVLAPSRMGSNPFVSKPPEPGPAGPAQTSGNPFAKSAVNSNSSDDEKPIVAPSHFNVPSTSVGTPQIVVTPVNHEPKPDPSRFLLRPSALDRQTANFHRDAASASSLAYKSNFKLAPAKLQSPLSNSDTPTKGDASVIASSKMASNPFVAKQPDFGTAQTSSNPFARADVADDDGPTTSTDSSSKPGLPTTTSATSESTPVDTASTTGGVCTKSDLPSASAVASTIGTAGTTSDQSASGATASSSSSSDSAEGKHRLFGEALPDKESSETTPESTGKPKSKQSNDGPDSTTDFVFGSDMKQRITSKSSDGGGFVFGQQLSQRVVTPPPSTEPDTGGDVTDDTPPEQGEVKTPERPTFSQSLAESAAAAEAKRAKPEYQQVELTTGEEEESNVIQINAKLFLFVPEAQTWSEKGHGLLRVNDMIEDDTGAFQSRLVMRIKGSLRVILNTKIWAGMTIERASAKSIRITAQVDGTVKVFLVMSQPKDTDQLYTAMDWRIQKLKMREESLSTHQSIEGRGQVRSADSQSDEGTSTKKARLEPDGVREESIDSSNIYPETEASNESCSSTIKSTSSD